MVEPYSDQIIKLLINFIQQDYEEDISVNSLEVIGELCESLEKSKLNDYKDSMIPELIICIQQGTPKISRYAILTLGKYVNRSGDVIDLYFDFPELLNTLLNVIKTQSDEDLRIEASRAIGIIGAIDPYSVKNMITNQKKFQNNLIGIIPGVEIDIEDYFPTIALSGLTKILENMSLALHHRDTAQCIMYIFTNLNTRSSKFLNQILEPFLFFIRNTKVRFY
jgi:serine/threonine-protein kinase mTOR